MNPSSPAKPQAPEQLAKLQKQFADHIRNPEQVPAPDGIEDRRMAIYRRLFFNNLSNLFGKNFPTVREIVPDEAWDAMIRDFMIRHRPTMPLFPEIGREFVRYLAEIRQAEDDPWPFLAELAHFEYLQTSVRNDEADIEATGAIADGDPTGSPPVLNPTLRLGQYQWPVHEIDAGSLPDQPAGEPVLILVYRHPDDRLGLMRVNPVTARLIVLLQENSVTSGLECLERIGREMKHPDPAALIKHGGQLLQSLRERNVILGSRPNQSDTDTAD